MRTAFIKELMRLAGEDNRVWLVCGDLGFSVLEEFSARFPDRFLNAGVAEQNMTGIAAGLALSGKVVFTYSIANFPTLRCLEQIRNDVCYHGCNVKIAAVGGGLGYGSLGFTHHGVEDIAIMRALPNMMVAAPGDPVEAQWVTRAALLQPGPCYLRFGKTGEPRVHAITTSFELGKAIRVRDGNAATLVVTGNLLHTAVQVSELLAQRGFPVAVLSMPWIKPLDHGALERAATNSKMFFTLEEHSILGGLGSAVCESLSGSGAGCRVCRFGLTDGYPCLTGSTEQMRKAMGLDVESLAGRMELILRGGSPP